MRKKPRFLVLVVLYKKTPYESETLVSLRHFAGQKDNVSVLVWDNTRTITAEDAIRYEFGFAYDGVANNAPLSVVYNRVIEKYFDHDFLVILDQKQKPCLMNSILR